MKKCLGHDLVDERIKLTASFVTRVDGLDSNLVCDLCGGIVDHTPGVFPND